MTTPVDDTLVADTADGPALVASVCGACGWREFPAKEQCGRCSGDVTTELLPRRGRVWSFTTQEFPLKPPYTGPEGATFALGYVELDGLVVEGRFDVPLDQVRTLTPIGAEVEVVVVPFDDTRSLYAFRPVAS